MLTKLIGFTLATTALILSGCTGTRPVTQAAQSNLTVGVVQKEIKAGMTQAEVASALGSPNIVTSGDMGKETWIYDKVSSSVNYEQSSAYGTLILIGGATRSGSAMTTQSTLTIIINFVNGVVDDYKYHSSKF